MEGGVGPKGTVNGSPTVSLNLPCLKKILLFNDILSKQRDFPHGSVVKNLLADAEDTGLMPESGRFPGEGNGNPL